jgi:hypothetical protein
MFRLRNGQLATRLNLFAGELSEQNNLFRMTCAMEAAKTMGWVYRLLSSRVWSGRYAVTINEGVNGIYVLRFSLDAAFDDNGRHC